MFDAARRKKHKKNIRRKKLQKDRNVATSRIPRAGRGIMRVVRSKIQQTNQQLKQPECASRLKKRTEPALQKTAKILKNQRKSMKQSWRHGGRPKNGSGREISSIFAPFWGPRGCQNRQNFRNYACRISCVFWHAKKTQKMSKKVKGRSARRNARGQWGD